MFWGSIVMLAYTFFGGFLAVSWSRAAGHADVFALILVAAVGVGLAGGFGEMIARIRRRTLRCSILLGSGGEAWDSSASPSLLAWALATPASRTSSRASCDPLGGRDPVARRVRWWGDRRAARRRWSWASRARWFSRCRSRPRHRGRVISDVDRVHCTPCSPASACPGSSPHHEHGLGQLLVASVASRDFYKGLFRRDPGSLELLWGGARRGARHWRCSRTCSPLIPRAGTRSRRLGLGRVRRGLRPGDRAVALTGPHDAQRRASPACWWRPHRDPVSRAGGSSR